MVGALAGFGALVYAVGAAILWLRYETTGFNADEALSVAPRGAVVSLGFRWLVGWGIAVGVLAVLMDWLRVRIGRTLPNRARKHIALRSLFVGLIGLVLASAAFLTWSALTLSVDLLAIATFVCWEGLRSLGRPERANRVQPTSSDRESGSSGATLPKRKLRRTSVIFVASLAALSAIGWQLEINLPYVAVKYRVAGQSLRYDGIYFGENDGNFYIARRPGAKGQFFRAISVYPAASISGIEIRPGTRTLCTRVNRPEVLITHAVSRAWDAIEQHFRRTGQPNPSPSESNASTRNRRETPPPGFCPPLP